MNQMQKKVFLTYFKTTILLITTFCLGCIIATGVARMLEKDKNSVADNKPSPADVREVFVLKNTIREGNEILPEDLLVVRRHKDTVPRGVVKTYQQIEGRSAKVKLPQGTVLLDEYFVVKLANGSAKGFIPPGFHSVPIQIYEPAAEGLKNHAVQPGDQVDVIIVMINEEPGEESGEHVLLENIPILDTLWSQMEDSRQQEKKGTVSLLLSDSQRKNLLDEFREGTKIRLRICPQVDLQAMSESQAQDSLDLAAAHDFYQTDNQPDLITQTLRNTSQGEIEIVFRGSSQWHDIATTQHALMPVNHREVQLPILRGIPSGSYAVESQAVSQVSAIDMLKPTVSSVENPPIGRYLSYYDPYGQKRNGSIQWQATVPHSPLVYEAKSDSQTQARGVYREGNTYFSAE